MSISFSSVIDSDSSSFSSGIISIDLFFFDFFFAIGLFTGSELLRIRLRSKVWLDSVRVVRDEGEEGDSFVTVSVDLTVDKS